jgi:hypothetical protein
LPARSSTCIREGWRVGHRAFWGLGRGQSGIKHFPEEGILRRRQKSHVFVGNSITILLQEPFSFICDVEGIVCDGKGCVAEPRLFENIFRLRLCDLGVKLLEERRVRSGWETRLLVQKREDAQLTLDDIDTRLIVGKFDELPVNLFLDIFLLFEFEDVCIELKSLSDDALIKYRFSLTSCCSFSLA